MKKAVLCFVAFLSIPSFIGCTYLNDDDEIIYEATTTFNEETVSELIDPPKDCPELDRNCNGIPDDEE